MKMRFTGFIIFGLLTISLLSYGASSPAFAANSYITATSDLDEVPNGATFTISGMIVDYDPSGHDLGYIITTPDEGFADIGQLTPDSDGEFTITINAGGSLWKTSGDYIVKFKYGAASGEVIINYVGGEAPPPNAIVVIDTDGDGVPDDVDECPDVAGNGSDGCTSEAPPPPPPPPTDTDGDGVPDDEDSCPDVAGTDRDGCPPPPVVAPPPVPDCGDGTKLENGQCVPDVDDSDKKTGCLIATATYGTELAPQVQLLREIRDNTLFSTASGTSFMTGFNQLYYSFSPTIADWERENPMFQEAVRAFITPMISTLSIMTLAENGSEVEVLGLGISIIALNLGMYIAAPALVGFKVHKHIKSRK